MKALIIEDEAMAQASLIRIMKDNYPDIDIVGTITSVAAAVGWLQDPANSADIIFMDVELSDGNCFEIFRRTQVEAKVIMTTAYDNYAVKAFEVNSVDYLLKPIDAAALRRAVGRAMKNEVPLDMEKLLAALGGASAEYKKRFIVKFNDKIIPVEASSVAYFYSEEKNTFLVTKEGRSYVIDLSLDEVCEQIDPRQFFRISRRCIISMDAIGSITKQFGGRLALEAKPAPSFEMTVSRSRVDDFLRWIER